MTETSILTDFRKKLCSSVAIEPQGVDRFLVFTPFMFDDGDHFVVVLRRNGHNWELTDEGHTLMHLEYSGVDLSTPTRTRVIEAALASHRIERRAGELTLQVNESRFGDSLFTFVQALSRISSVTDIIREGSHEGFADDLRSLIEETVPEEQLYFNWTDPNHDRAGNYPVDFVINGRAVPWFLFGIGSDTSCRLATITCLNFEKWGTRFRSIAVFRDQASISRRSLAQISDVIGKQFSSLDDRTRIKHYLQNEVLTSV